MLMLFISNHISILNCYLAVWSRRQFIPGLGLAVCKNRDEERRQKSHVQLIVHTYITTAQTAEMSNYIL